MSDAWSTSTTTSSTYTWTYSEAPWTYDTGRRIYYTQPVTNSNWVEWRTQWDVVVDEDVDQITEQEKLEQDLISLLEG